MYEHIQGSMKPQELRGEMEWSCWTMFSKGLLLATFAEPDIQNMQTYASAQYLPNYHIFSMEIDLKPDQMKRLICNENIHIK